MSNSRDAYERFNKTTPPLSPSDQAACDELMLDIMLRKGFARREDDGSIKYLGIPDTPEPEIARLGSVPGGDQMDAILAGLPKACTIKDKCRALLMSNYSTREITRRLNISDALVSNARRGILRDVELGLITPASLPTAVVNPRALNYERHPETRERPDMRSVDGHMSPTHPMMVAARSQNRSVAEVAQDAVAHRVNGRYEPPQGREQAAKGDEIAASRKLEERDARALLMPTPAKKTPAKKRGPRTFKYTGKPPPFPSDDK